ncbi:MAG: beta-mannosidase [Flavobacteriaceae bacterium CG02_land_8_20_14_3_00_34_13]|nr:MAG: beta-mannosidase [Flavobacteriaceae bacterium CG02_land_8_20_14_3_00_34_13]
MLRARYKIFIIVVLLFSGCDRQPKQAVSKQPEQAVSRQSLHFGWQFKNTNDSIWHPASVPGTVHTDLYENKLIPHPFVGDKELQLQWISETRWEYQTNFSVDEKTLQKRNHLLNFEGLDTYAAVFLNDSLILKTHNAFRKWNADVKSLLKEENILKIIFEPTHIFEKTEKVKLGYELPEGNRVFSRKAQFQYGWDWSPKFITSGIWRDITLESWDKARLGNTYIKQISLTDTLAHLEAEIELNITEKMELVVDVLVSDKLVASEEIELTPGEHLVKIPFEITNPKRWWPHNLGKPHLYDMEVQLKHKNVLIDAFKLKKGLRTIEHITQKDADGESFYFKINGVPAFMKGANYIPQNSFQNWVNEAHYEQLLNDVVAANMNMLRIWGGGIYENDIFYQKCDAKGILVWQDFMFACAMYPGDDDFLNNVQQEAIDNVKRLRNFSSIALWCGNNENSEGWHRWGWQDARGEAEKEEIWDNYLKVFDSILPKTVAQLTDVAYWETSPKFGRGDARYKTEGDAHDWWIWHDKKPFEDLEKNVPRFMSEFGFQGFPSFEAIRFINGRDSVDLISPEFKTHQKHKVGFETIKEYMERDFPVPDKAEDYVYMSQLLQAYGIGKGIEAHRRARPYTMGSLYWQLNDCWPAVSWSSIDFFGNWKALHYQAKRSFENLLISSEIVNDTLQVYIVNDYLKEYKDSLKIEVLDFNGLKLQEYSKSVRVQPNSSAVYLQIPVKGYAIVANRIVFVATFQDKQSLFYMTKPKDLALEKVAIHKSIREVTKGFEIDLTSEALQKNIFLYSNQKGHFSDNFFDLLPGAHKKILFKTNKKNNFEFQTVTLNELIPVQ